MATSKNNPLQDLASTGEYLGDYAILSNPFPDLDPLFASFQSAEFQKLNEREKNEKVNRALLSLIQAKSDEGFLLIPVVDFIERVNKAQIFNRYNISNFEFWLNQFSGLSFEENYAVRAALVGKKIPRDEYQILFPIGMGKLHSGSHFVTAHTSPDLDTTVASFWGWVDAFGARIGDGLHIWNLPGGPPSSQIEVDLLFNKVFGENVFNYLIKDRTALSISGLDLLTQKGLVKKLTDERATAIDHERHQHAIVLVDNEGFYLGDWRHFDVEGVRQIIFLLNLCLGWFENHLHLNLISLFSKESLTTHDLPAFIASVFEIKISDCEPVKKFTEKQKTHLQDYLQKVLHVEKGLSASFEEFSQAMKLLKIFDFQEFIDFVEALKSSSLFDKNGKLEENRPRIFNHLEKVIKGLDKAIQSIHAFVETLNVALNIKKEVFGNLPQSVNHRADLEELRSKMGHYSYLTITTSDNEGRLIPLGIIHSSDIHKPVLGTVSLRDFCNREETKIPSYLEVISVIDHHKSSLNTASAPVAFISDTQSSNSIVAEIAFKINDQYSTGGLTHDEIKQQIAQIQKDLSSSRNKRILQRLLQKQMVFEKGSLYFVSPVREFLEYLQCLYAIIDDTDLLTKVSARDLECVASLLNRMKSLLLRKETEVISLEGVTKDKEYLAKASALILQNADMYSLYRKVYLAKETAVEENIRLSSQSKPSNFFADTKVQNGCCRVGQTKMFATNFLLYHTHSALIQKYWYETALETHKDRPEIDLHLHMISTIAGAEDLYKGNPGVYDHKDEMWLWIPPTDQAIQHLKSFLNALRFSPALLKNALEVEFLGDNKKVLGQIFKESFLPIPHSQGKNSSLPIAILRFNAGSLNSRKAMVSPYLPRLDA